VHSDFRKHGVARAMLDHLAASAKDHGARRMRLFTVRETGNVAIFSRMGFTVIDEHEDTLFESESYSSLTEVEMERAWAASDRTHATSAKP
jgi:ribosomal protein S18 acetylase RimI-like enzyme